MHLRPCRRRLRGATVDAMGTSTSLHASELAVEPGEVVTTTMRVRNTGTVVDQIAFHPLGDAAPWITVEPPVVSLFPDADETVTVRIAPPRVASTRPGPTSFAVKALPQEDPDGASVAEGTVEVGRFSELDVELVPAVGRGRRRGRFDLAVDNRGNVALPVRLSGSDEGRLLAFAFRPARVEAAPGTAHFAKIRVAPSTRIWKGAPKAHPFQLLVEPDAPAPLPVADGDVTDEQAGPPSPAGDPMPAPRQLAGTYLQEPLLPAWLPMAAAVLVGLLVAGFVLWKTLLEPTVESAAREIAVEEVAAVDAQVEELSEEVADNEVAAQDEVADLAEQVAATSGGAADGGGGGGGAGLAGVLDATSVPVNFRLETTAPVGGSNGETRTVESDSTFALTDIVMQNPQGDLGRLVIEHDGVAIFDSALDNFRDLDFHFVSPYVFAPGSTLSISVRCDAVVPPNADCNPSVSFAGFETPVQPATVEAE